MADFQRNGLADRDIDQAITALKKGAYLLKYGRRGKPKFCPFKLSNDESKVVWYSGKKEKHVKLSEVCKIIPGQRTTIFQRYPRPEKEYQSFSLICNDRSLNLICKDKDEAEVWLSGLKALIFRGTYTKWGTEVVNGNASVDGSQPCNQKNAPNSQLDPENAKGLQAHYEASNSLGKAFANIITHTASVKIFDLGLVSPGSVETSNSRRSGADAIRTSLSSVVSSSSQGSSRSGPDPLGDVFIWGQGIGNGVLGGGTDKIGNSFNTKTDALLPKELASTVVLDVNNIACGGTHAALVTKQGHIFSWGEESGGRLGHGVETDVPKPKLIDILSGMNFESVACGEYHTCAVTVSGDLLTWGDGTHNLGVLGHGTEVGHWIPKRVNFMEGIHVSFISCGPWHTALVTYGGQLFTFGDGSFGALGHGDYTSSTIPREVETLSESQTTKVACGAWHTAAVVKVLSEPCDSGSPSNSSSAKLFTWGDGDKGQLGHGDNQPRLFPECVDACDKICNVACGYKLTVALTTSGLVYTMGSSAYGQLGSATADGKIPTRVEGKIAYKFVEEIACGSYHVAVLTSKTKVYTWGKGTNGQLGHGDINDRNTPTPVDFLKDRQVKSVACGSNFTAVVSLHTGVDHSLCSGCRNPFGFRRKHTNCYNCGLIFCKLCTSRKSLNASMAPAKTKPYRVCDECFLKLRKGAEPISAVWTPQAKNGILPRKSIDRDALAPRLQTEVSRLSVDSFYQAESRNFKHELKLESQTRLLFPVQNGNFHVRGGFYSPKMPICPIRDSKNILPASISSSKRTSRGTSPASGKLSPNRSSGVTVDDSKQMNESANQEIINLRAQVEDLTYKSQHLEAELEKTSKKLKEVTAIAENEAKKCKSANEVIRSLTAQLKEMADELPAAKNARQNSISIAKNTSNTEYLCSDSCHATTIGLPQSEASCNLENVSNSHGTKGQTEKSEIVIQDEPGVYLTLSPLPDGGNELKRVRFSKKHFTEERAESWWAENGDKVCERHNIISMY
ncbi:PH, RCC1 and FYVE domains-containing protein 1-like isoform X2 [Hibiscus syriacus]|uniref:PH, RCC1 and FYVE domains-containing protein 1-like isoform X2 n=1 Tax=Hibiscus syriacus TaxID=106335 RepID=UPI0019239C32|nr:PH, RCC1 and FYVE domains-containing protein 1-like isoform X2 [Hibiscus syriacus]